MRWFWKIKNWYLIKFCGYVRISDFVRIDINLSPCTAIPPKFNPDLIIGTKRPS